MKIALLIPYCRFYAKKSLKLKKMQIKHLYFDEAEADLTKLINLWTN
jgi:hypothetical protein